MKLSSTSSLVLLWAQEQCAHTEKSKSFLCGLDLSEGAKLYQQCSEKFPYAEVILNRKYGIRHLIGTEMSEPGGPWQVVIAGAGFDPLGIDLAEENPGLRIYEVDRERMGEKAERVAALGGAPAKQISFIEADLMDSAAVKQGLLGQGWRPDKPTILTMEGISYYLSPDRLQALVRVLTPDAVVLEYLKPSKEIDPDRQEIPKRVFRLIEETCGLSHIYPMTRSEAVVLFPGMRMTRGYGMKELEQMRTGANPFFRSEGSGWIEVILLQAVCVDEPRGAR